MLRQKFYQKFYIILTLLLTLTLAFATKALASLTFTSNAITGTSPSTIDLGVGQDLYLQTSGGKVGIGTASPDSVLHIRGSNPSLTINDSRDQTWTVGDEMAGINFTSNDGSNGFTNSKVRARIAVYQDGNIFGNTQSFSFWTSDTTSGDNGNLRQRATMDYLGRWTLNTQSTRNIEPLYINTYSVGEQPNAITIFDQYQGGGGDYIAFKIMDSVSTPMIGARIGTESSGKSGPGLFASTLEFETANNATAAKRWRITGPGHFLAVDDNTYDIGASGATRPRTGYFGTSVVSPAYYYTTTVFDGAGSGSPEGVVTAGIGSTYRRTNGGANTSFYVKESGTGNTGWVAK